MKYLFSLLALITFSCNLISQDLGNAYYLNRVDFSQPQQQVTTPVNMPADDDIYITISGLANLEADAHGAIFSVSQMGKTVEEVNSLMDNRINSALAEIKQKENVETYIDMISFVPVYEFELLKKRFRKDSYQEIPSGFELKKNIHIKYTNPNLLNDFIAILSKHEIYDLVKTDYFSSEIGATKKLMMNKAKEVLKEKVANYEDIMTESLDTNIRQLTDNYNVLLPQEMYKSYQAYCRSSLNLKSAEGAKQANKSKTHYYQPIVDKDFDFVINPIIMKPVIQVTYSITLKITVDRQPQIVQKIVEKEIIKKEKEYILVTPDGAIKSLP